MGMNNSLLPPLPPQFQFNMGNGFEAMQHFISTNPLFKQLQMQFMAKHAMQQQQKELAKQKEVKSEVSPVTVSPINTSPVNSTPKRSKMMIDELLKQKEEEVGLKMEQDQSEDRPTDSSGSAEDHEDDKEWVHIKIE